MIQLHPDYLVLRTADGETFPCSAEEITVELIGESASMLDPEFIRQIARAVLHYFKHDLGRHVVSVVEFSHALERVLKGLGFKVHSPDSPASGISSDLRELASECSEAFELEFFPSLRDALRKNLQHSPQVLRFCGLRDCVKQLIGAKRWNNRCQQLSDQIVEYIRHCLETEETSINCSLVIR